MGSCLGQNASSQSQSGPALSVAQTLGDVIDISAPIDTDDTRNLNAVASKFNSAESKSLKPILDVNQNNVTNGIIPIIISNLDAIDQNIDQNMSFTYTLSYKFTDIFIKDTDTNLYENNTWKEKAFEHVTNTNTFWIKVPLFLRPYSMQFTLSIKFSKHDQWISVKSAYTTKSIEYSINIPSILLDMRKFNIGQNVSYRVKTNTICLYPISKELKI